EATTEPFRRRRRGRRRARSDAALRRGRDGGRRAPRSLALRARRRARRGHGPVRLRQVDAHAHPRRARQADQRHGRDRGHRDHRPERRHAHPPPARPHRLRLPVLQPAPHAHRGGERRPPPVDRRREAGPRVARRPARPHRHREAPLASAVGALRRRAATRRDLARAGDEADDPLRRRADRQPRLEDRRRDPRPRPGLGRLLRPDDRHGHARGARRSHRRPHPVHRRRPHRSGAQGGDDRRRARRHEPSELVTRVALKGLLGRKLRAFLTGLAIVLGVAMISGTYVLTDTIKSAFSTVFTTVYAKTDAVISGKNALGGNNNSNNGLPPSFPESLLGKVQKLPGVAEASGGISDLAHLVGRDGKVISGHGSPGLAFSVHPHGSQRFNPLTLTSGTWASGPHQIDIDAHTASKDHYAVGDTIGVIARGPVVDYTIAGIVKIGGVSSLGGATMAIFDFATAQRIFHKEGKLDGIDIAAKPGVKPSQLVQQIQPILPPTAQVRTAQGEAKQATKDTNGFLSIFNDFLLAFAGVALFVGVFVIANTLSITVTQRTRELATLRTLGAYKRQVQASVLLEAGVIGALASVTGLFIGLGLAKGLNALFVHLGIDLPQAGTVFATRTIVVSLVVGIVVTVLAALWPAFRATRVPPVSAVREGAVLQPLLSGPAVTTVALSTIAGAVALMLVGLFVGSLSTTQRLLAVGIGAAAVFLGVALLAKVLVPPLANVLGWPATRIGGAAGSLARGNAMRNPSRTAAA